MLKKVDPFIFGLIVMILLAWIFPAFGNYEGAFSLNNITSIGISLIFFFYGLKLSPQHMYNGLKNSKLHILIQLTTFLLFPALVFLGLPFVHTDSAHQLWLAMFFLAALPSTVSSSVVMVVLAKGNVPGAIFNASLSGLLGIIITPLWMSLFLAAEPGSFGFTDTIISLIVKILLPVALGLMLNSRLGNLAKTHSTKLAWFDKSIILAIVYKSFSTSFSSGLFASIGLLDILSLLFAVIFLFVVVYAITYKSTQLLDFSREDRITTVFCGSKKSLVHGTVMTKVLFSNMTSQGIFILPIMMYHTMQLIVISFIAQQKSKE